MKSQGGFLLPAPNVNHEGRCARFFALACKVVLSRFSSAGAPGGFNTSFLAFVFAFDCDFADARGVRDEEDVAGGLARGVFGRTFFVFVFCFFSFLGFDDDFDGAKKLGISLIEALDGKTGRTNILILER